MLNKKLLAASIIAGFALAGGANASLSLFQSYTGNVGVSTDGCGSNAATCTLQTLIPTGSTITAAYLYSSTFAPSTNPNGTTFNGNAVTFAALGPNNVGLQAWRADVTSIVQGGITLGSTTTWTVNEGNNTAAIDGEALVVVYANAAQETQTVFILDGFSQTGGDTSSITFDPLPAGFVAQLMIGDGFSFDGTDPNNPSQSRAAGVDDQSQRHDAHGRRRPLRGRPVGDLRNGSLITVGGFNAGSKDDAFTPFPNPLIGQDHEHYNLGNILGVGATSAVLEYEQPEQQRQHLPGGVQHQRQGTDRATLAGARIACIAGRGAGRPVRDPPQALVSRRTHR